ncbi:MAG: hypothetical protein EOM54_05320 [Clostridia bacterium]|nr:hypothetical protein [Clostridia bacterium]
MKSRPVSFILWVLIAIMCVSVISIPTSASDRDAETLDAVAGSRSGVYQLLGARSGSTYDIYTSAGIGGSVSSSVSAAAPGKTVNIYIEQKSGYQTASIFVITATGTEIEVMKDNGTFSFKMPDEPVVIDVTFQYIRIV